MQTNILNGGKRQFVLATQAVQADGWRSEQLSNGYVLSWHKEMKVSINKGKNICLLGHAWSVTSDNQMVIENMGGGRQNLCLMLKRGGAVAIS